MAWSVAGDSKTYPELEGWSRGGNGVSHERSLWPAIERKIPDRVNDGQFVRKPLPTAHGDGESIQPESIGGQGLLSAQVREVGSGIASLGQVVKENQRDSTERVER